MLSMSLRHEELSPQDSQRQHELQRSWANAQDALADPQFRARLEDSIARVNASAATATMSKDEFLAETEPTVQ